MIAILNLEFSGTHVKAALDDDGKWTCPDESIQRHLKLVCDPRDFNGPAFGPFGAAAVMRALELYSGKVLWQREADQRPERVY
jgi:hypothetical protein